MPSLTDLNSGRMSVRYGSGRLRYVRSGGAEILRQIYMAVRDRHWNTIPARLVEERVESTPAGFLVEIAVEHRQGDIDFRWRGRFEGSGNRIEAVLDGQAHSSFLRNRIGWCVLHPTRECLGKLCRVLHPDASVQRLAFPLQVSPHQPFLDISAMSWSPAPGLRATLEFEGDIFETEDQRNWTDDSFKTYSTPLRLPYPVQLNPGDRVVQRIVLTLDERPAIRFTGAVSKFPEIAVVGQVANLRAIANRAGAFEAIITVRTRADLEAAKHLASIARWIVYDAGKPATTPETIALAREVLGENELIGGGADTNFAELNRNGAVAAVADFVAFSANPQAHGTDEHTIVENLPAIGAAIESARAMAGGKPVFISPLTFKRRFNPHARDAGEPPDSRERERFGAAWLVGAIKHAAEAGAAGITLAPHPVLDRILAFDPETVLATECSHTLQAVALALQRGSERLVLIANLTNEPVDVEFEDRTLGLGPYECTETP